MLFPDYHFHTDFSSDCDEPMQAVIASAKEKGLSALCVTDHYDMDFPVHPEEPAPPSGQSWAYTLPLHCSSAAYSQS